jgi:hypothetical protein
MSQSESSETSTAVILRKLGRLGRFVIFLCTAGWAFPHICTEGMDLTKIQNEHMARKS